MVDISLYQIWYDVLLWLQNILKNYLKIFEKQASFERLVRPFLLVCLPSYNNYYFGHALMQLFLYLFSVSGVHVKSFYGWRKTETIATKIKIPNTDISSDEDLSNDNSRSI